MKKFFKYLLLILLISAVSFTLIFRNRISLYISFIKNATIMKDNFTKYDYANFDELSNINDVYTTLDISYKTTNNSNLTLDIYGPPEKAKNGCPVILYVHGGSWLYGDKAIPSVLTPLLDTFRNEGYYVISVSYELITDRFNFDKQISDVKDAIRWIYKNKDTYSFNTDQIGLLGVSAGAHLGLMAAYSDNSEFTGDKDLSNYPSKIKYLIDFFGPTDLSTLDLTTADSNFDPLLNNIHDKASMIKKYSPINYVKGELPNTLIIHSKNDTMVPYENSEELYNKIISSGNKAKFISVEELNHDLSNINIKDATEIIIKVFNFFVNNSPL